jgi:hypothetical protein
MPVIDYDPNKQTAGDDVPAGSYEVEFIGTVDRPAFTDARFQQPGKSPEPRLGWQFKILSGAFAGKVIEQGTGTYPSPKSKLVYVLGLMQGGACPAGKTDTGALIGRRYWLTWARNDKSEKGRNHIAALMQPPAGSPPPPQPPPPPRPKDDPEFWIPSENGVRNAKASEIRALIREGKGPSQVCPLDGAGGWQPPAKFGLTGDAPKPAPSAAPPSAGTGAPAVDPKEPWIFWDEANKREQPTTRGELSDLIKNDSRTLDAFAKRPGERDWRRIGDTDLQVPF